ncbi:glycine decarboxylase, PLP-dependent, subunit (protein P) of glycine cleavage complex [Candidatus Methylobacter favarea]|uniref:Glycine dehydrogenase (decarboxylating) n=1 Tax=Candidatus Methylobacter favarea TaxID=2707345 RepID=A0A8S0X8G1_9GAMM|nr:aminomethyl-transferring glycine dehydrogenase [Candidatus Methylobacter favarea]CAA9891110.1 glycine decarboxylase, PLP-dependent, subunit (protein P) of glycine cleavage complex [Candidatus Methylobacter favarea]
MPTSRPRLDQLEMRGNFISRHIGPNPQQIKEMLAELGLNELEDIIEQAIPADILTQEPLKLTETVSENAVIKHLRKMRERNKVFTSMIGMGYYDTTMPAVIKRNVLENPGWYTAYTPYQAEVSQGRLEALLNFQQMIMDLTGMALANASLLDEATAAAEAMTMSRRLSKSAANSIFVDQDCHPQTIAVVKTRARSLGYEVIIADPHTELEQHDFFALLVQYPGSRGEIKDISRLTATAHTKSALVTVAADLLSLVLLKPPAEFGTDIVVGNSQRFGVPMGYGGPHAAFFATRDDYKRSVPGRIIGVSKDSRGQVALRMALQTREQHIRRDKATSNICTSQVLLAVIAGFYAIYHGAEGLRLIAGRVHRYTQILAIGISRLGHKIVSECYFDTIIIHTPNRAKRFIARAAEANINLRLIDADHLGIALDETTTRANLRELWQVFASATADLPDINALDASIGECIPEQLLRTDEILQHPVFALYHSETEMMRYMRRLARRDIALDRSMIPLGSCTMKLNAATEMQTISYHEFNALHPFAPLYQTHGYQQMFAELEDMLCDLTGFDAFSLQPNAGSQGEYTGLLVIRKYHEVAGQAQRNICLIPASAHGTNPASATMAGLKVVVVACDENGNVSLDDLRAKVADYQNTLAALMITYPSTHGVYEQSFREICDIIHQHGGQVYLDGANFNALVGISRPGKIGADVAHLNLHKTFCIPHGGGGPGVGPIGVGAHLAPFLPDHPVVEGINPARGEHGTIGTVSAAPWGSASILTISWAYIAMMGAAGLKQATLTAILNANYIARRLAPYYPILYTGKNGWVAHECIIDCHDFKKTCNITVEDIAKRLIDFGFHAPTVSFPVADTLMIEPTESENKVEIDRFCAALIAIREEIKAIETGSAGAENNVLHNAPHTHRLLLQEWTLPYSRQQAFFPDGNQHDDKYWPPVGRIDNVYGDRHVICTCPPLSDYE